MTRIAIAGGPRTGKTTAASTLPGAALHTDDVMRLGWSAASQEVSTWFDRPGDVVVEGVAVPRALRKWLKRNPVGMPVETVVLLAYPYETLTPGQSRMTKGHATVWSEIEPQLRARGVEILNRMPSP